MSARTYMLAYLGHPDEEIRDLARVEILVADFPRDAKIDDEDVVEAIVELRGRVERTASMGMSPGKVALIPLDEIREIRVSPRLTVDVEPIS